MSSTTTTTPQSPNPLGEKFAEALALGRELSLALIICYKMPNALAFEVEVVQVTDILHQLAENMENRHVEFEAVDVVVERCFDVLFSVQEVIEEFLDVEDEVFREGLKRRGGAVAFL